MIVNEKVSAFPLQWPLDWKRTPSHARKRAQFGSKGTMGKSEITVAAAAGRVSEELRRLKVDVDNDMVISTNIRLRLDGLPRSGEREPEDPGVAVYFVLKKKPIVLACDKWDKVAGNLAAIAAHIGALRGQERWGVGSLDRAFTGYAALNDPSVKKHWRAVLGFDATTPFGPGIIQERFKYLARTHHPDAGGDARVFADIVRARDEALKECSR